MLDKSIHWFSVVQEKPIATYKHFKEQYYIIGRNTHGTQDAGKRYYDEECCDR